MDTQALNKKLAEWAGFKKYATYGWDYPDGQWRRYLPYFDDSLNACFEWLVPKLNEQGLRVHMITQPRGRSDFFCSIGGKWVAHECIYAETPALALCRAIEGLIDEKDSNSS